MDTLDIPYPLASFDLPSLRTSINEAPGYCALFIQATDVDEGENAELRYSIDLAANCTPPGGYHPRSQHHLDSMGVGEGENEERERIRTFRHNTFRMDERTGKLLLVRRLAREEVGVYCLGLVVEDQGHPSLKSIQVS